MSERATALPLVVIVVILMSLVAPSWAVKCFECFDTGPTNANCTQSKNCTGEACLIFDDGLNVTTRAFCLLAADHAVTDATTPGCWLEPDGKGRHCACFSDFCNKLPDKTLPEADSKASLIKGLPMLQRNPFIQMEEYDDDTDEAPKKGDATFAKPLPSNLLFPSATEEDEETAGEDENDLVPVDFAEYTSFEAKIAKSIDDKDDDDDEDDDDSAATVPTCTLLPLLLLLLPQFAL